MKKVKIMLMSVAVVAVVGGALAFKAKTFSESNVFCAKVAGACENQVLFATTPNGNQPVTSPCAGTTIVYTDPGCVSTTVAVNQAIFYPVSNE